jgi:hypothetical protein
MPQEEALNIIMWLEPTALRARLGGAPAHARTAAHPATLGQRKEKIYMIHRISVLILMLLLFSIGLAVAGDSEKEKIALNSAEKWLGIVDAGKYAESWKEAAGLFRNAVKQEQWEQSLQAVRKPLGKLVLRKIGTKAYRTSLPGAPDGEYVVNQFESSFEKKKSAVETVTLMLEKDGKWRVSGYYIK